MNKVRTALVIGGGIAGPVTALALRRAGIDATVYEGRPSAADDLGAMLTLAPNGLNALRIVGADQVVEAIGHPVPGVVMADSAGNELADFAGFPDLPATRALARAELFEALADHTRAQGVAMHYDSRLTSVVEGPDGVTAVFADGRSATADVLIGADGIRSTVRALIDPSAPGPAYAGVLSFGASVRGSGVPAKSERMYFAFGKAFLGYWQTPQDDIVWFGSLPHPEPMTAAAARAVPAAEWLARLRELYAGHVPGEVLLGHTDPEQLIVVGPMEFMPSMRNWHRGRMVLVGDAVHAPSSSSGQGASQAIESAVELARCLRDLPDATSAFAAYEHLRRPRVEAIAMDAAAKNKAKAGKTDGAPAFPTPEQMFSAIHHHGIDWDAPVTLG
jgi:2-polyprenyl-6-methoxyphenol hydroxylase-like FAD-dependent oxidoreductase